MTLFRALEPHRPRALAVCSALCVIVLGPSVAPARADDGTVALPGSTTSDEGGATQQPAAPETAPAAPPTVTPEATATTTPVAPAPPPPPAPAPVTATAAPVTTTLPAPKPPAKALRLVERVRGNGRPRGSRDDQEDREEDREEQRPAKRGKKKRKQQAPAKATPGATGTTPGATATTPGASATTPAAGGTGPAQQTNVATADVQAQNVSHTLQVVIQIQRGCRAWCTDVVQTQIATQVSDTTQTSGATAVVDQTAENVATGGGTPGGAGEQTNAADAKATAGNQATTTQLTIQIQKGCRRNCTRTQQVQDAWQDAVTTQDATAVAHTGQQAQNAATGTGGTSVSQTSSATASATTVNVARIDQAVIQVQTTCRRRCDTTTTTQVSTQLADVAQQSARSATTRQAAVNVVSSGGLDLTGLVGSSRQINVATVQSWALTQNVVVDVTIQIQDAACMRRCTGTSQLQEALQVADVVQTAISTGQTVQVASNRSTITGTGTSAGTGGTVSQQVIEQRTETATTVVEIVQVLDQLQR